MQNECTRRQPREAVEAGRDRRVCARRRVEESVPTVRDLPGAARTRRLVTERESLGGDERAQSDVKKMVGTRAEGEALNESDQ